MNTTDIAPRLRLRHGSWNALRSVIAGERVPRSELRELWDLNVLDGTALTDPAQELLEGLTGMAGVVHVLGSDAGALRSASVWVAADGVGLLDQIDGDYTILQRVERGIVPPSIVELLNLGPRPQLTEPESQTVPASLVNNVLAPPRPHRGGRDREGTRYDLLPRHAGRPVGHSHRRRDRRTGPHDDDDPVAPPVPSHQPRELACDGRIPHRARNGRDSRSGKLCPVGTPRVGFTGCRYPSAALEATIAHV